MKGITEKDVLVKILNVSAESRSINWEAVNNRWHNQEENVTDHGVQAHEFANGLIVFPYGVRPQFFENRIKIDIAEQTSRTVEIISIEETGKTHQYTQIHILDLVWQSMDNFGVNEVPSKYQELVPDALATMKAIKTELRRLRASSLEIHINWDSWCSVGIQELDDVGALVKLKSLFIEETLANWRQLRDYAGTQATWENIVEGID